jgi:ABC-2 type transport system ATP-binding protein
MIDISDLSVRFGRTVALDGLNLQLPAGQCVLLAGANGSGKTTLLRSLAGVLFPDRGRITLNGVDVYPRRRPKIAYIAASLSCYDGLTLLQAVRLQAGFHPGLEYHEIEGYRFDLNRRVGGLSRGEKTLFLLNLALSAHPDYLLVDDLIHVLDPHLRDVFLHHILTLLEEQRLTLVLASQSAAEIEGVLERVVILAQGRIVLDETVEDVKRKFVRAYLDRVPMNLPVAFWREWKDLKEVYFYPYSPDLGLVGEVEYLTLPDILRAVIGGRYDHV